MKNKYRIVSDNFQGFEVQIKRWWFPFWFQCWNHATEVVSVNGRDEVRCSEHANRLAHVRRSEQRENFEEKEPKLGYK